jgi:7-cyano-7-deazaguanine synthase
MTQFPAAVLLSGGLDSAVLLAEESAAGAVQPIYVAVGLTWERAELAAVETFLARREFATSVRPLISLTVDMSDVYPAQHWARTGLPPGYHTPDADVYLPGRNIILLSKAAVFCAASRIGRIAIGTLDHNPFPDATPAFRDTLGAALSLGLGQRLEIDAPYARLTKADVIRRGKRAGVPLELTLSCMNPQPTAGSNTAADSAIDGVRVPFRHCGLCSKCRERHDAFVAAGVADLTDYADTQFVRA